MVPFLCEITGFEAAYSASYPSSIPHHFKANSLIGEPLGEDRGITALTLYFGYVEFSSSWNFILSYKHEKHFYS